MCNSVALSPGSTSVIICTYTSNRWNRLILAITSIHQQTCPAHEIIVVVDHNHELFLRAQHELTEVQVIENNGARGLSNARNSGIALARGTIVAFLDDDAIAAPDWLLKMGMALLDSAVPGVGSAVVPDWEGRKPFWFPAEFYWVVGCSYRGLPRENARIRNPIGASMCIRNEIFQIVGGFHHDIGRVGTLPVGCEETEFCIRAHQYWPERYFLYLPHVSVAHFVPRKRTTWRYFCSRCYAEGISKAAITRLVGTEDSLSSERAYILRTLSSGIIVNVGLALLERRLSYLSRAAAIFAGFCITMTGYLVGKYALLPPHKNVKVRSKNISNSE
jgi:glucosyl-dolichyl phosphate glucuronosyltransferase